MKTVQFSVKGNSQYASKMKIGGNLLQLKLEMCLLWGAEYYCMMRATFGDHQYSNWAKRSLDNFLFLGHWTESSKRFMSQNTDTVQEN